MDKVSATNFDNDFGNIAIKAEFTINFSNPIDSRFLAAQAQVTMKGTASISIIDHFLFSFQITQEQVKVQKFTPYFLSETTVAEFEEEYLHSLQDKILNALNKKFSTGIYLPLGADLNLEPIPMKVNIYKDYLLLETWPQTLTKEQASRNTSWSHFSTYDPQKESQKLRKYPLTWVVDQSHELTRSNGDNSNGSTAEKANAQCKGNNC